MSAAKATFQSYDDPQKHRADIYPKAAGQRTVIMLTSSGDRTTTVHGNAAWTAAPLTDPLEPLLVLTGISTVPGSTRLCLSGEDQTGAQQLARWSTDHDRQ